MLNDLNDRLRQILKTVVDAYVETGEPVGSSAVAQILGQKLGATLSPATIRNAMADLEAMGLLYAPHTSAGRLPTDYGFSVFVDGLVELDTLSDTDRRHIETTLGAGRHTPADINGILETAGGLLSGLAGCAGLVFAPTTDDALKQVDFVALGGGRVLAVLVSHSGMIENRLMEIQAGVDAGSLMRAANYINSHLARAAQNSRTLGGIAEDIRHSLDSDRQQLDTLTARLVESGLAVMTGTGSTGSNIDTARGHLLVRGQAKLLNDVSALADLERVRQLFEALEAKENMLALLQSAATGDGVRIFIGAENSLFGHAGCTMIAAPYKSPRSNVVGAIGVIGPTRLPYGRIIPVINYTSEVIGRAIGNSL